MLSSGLEKNFGIKFLPSVTNIRLLKDQWFSKLSQTLFLGVGEKFEIFKVESNLYFMIKFNPREL